MMKAIVWLMVVVFLVVLGPILLIWSLNTLFPALNIPMSLETWAAVVLLSGLFRTTVNVKRD